MYCFKDVFLRGMVVKMRKIYDKYRGKPGLLNMLLLMPYVLHPMYTLKYVNRSINDNFNLVKAKELKDFGSPLV